MISKSKSHPDYPPTSSAVRAHTQLGGYYAVEVEEGVTDLWFYMECDLKITMFIAKQTVPKSSNYANFLREYIHKKKGI